MCSMNMCSLAGLKRQQSALIKKYIYIHTITAVMFGGGGTGRQHKKTKSELKRLGQGVPVVFSKQYHQEPVVKHLSAYHNFESYSLSSTTCCFPTVMSLQHKLIESNDKFLKCFCVPCRTSFSSIRLFKYISKAKGGP